MKKILFVVLLLTFSWSLRAQQGNLQEMEALMEQFFNQNKAFFNSLDSVSIQMPNGGDWKLYDLSPDSLSEHFPIDQFVEMMEQQFEGMDSMDLENPLRMFGNGFMKINPDSLGVGQNPFGLFFDEFLNMVPKIEDENNKIKKKRKTYSL